MLKPYVVYYSLRSDLLDALAFFANLSSCFFDQSRSPGFLSHSSPDRARSLIVSVLPADAAPHCAPAAFPTPRPMPPSSSFPCRLPPPNHAALPPLRSPSRSPSSQGWIFAPPPVVAWAPRWWFICEQRCSIFPPTAQGKAAGHPPLSYPHTEAAGHHHGGWRDSSSPKVRKKYLFFLLSSIHDFTNFQLLETNGKLLTQFSMVLGDLYSYILE